nr:uncharacterized protein C3orf38 homolog isoform X2 [Cherax quadricarinatus]
MSLLHSIYEAGVRGLLEMLDSEALLALARTSTNNRILPLNSSEAIEIILLHTPDLGRFFSYRRLSAQTLFLYLHKYQVPSMGFANKNQMIMAVKDLWEKQCGRKAVSKPTTLKRRASSDPEIESPKGTQVEKNIANDDTESEFDVTPFAQPIVSVIRSDDFTRDFCEWYFNMVNRLQPVCAHHIGDTFREDIFYSNSFADIYFIGHSCGEKHAQGRDNTYALLRETFMAYSLLFSPNLENGTQAFKSDHGLVKICCCGTLHHKNALVGIFEQESGLVCSPVDRAWKIMYIKINLKQSNTLCERPSLPPCQLFEIET